jgi:hypothetical protein
MIEALTLFQAQTSDASLDGISFPCQLCRGVEIGGLNVEELKGLARPSVIKPGAPMSLLHLAISENG